MTNHNPENKECPFNCDCVGIGCTKCIAKDCSCSQVEAKERWDGMKYQLSQAILGGMEYRGFYDCGKYLDDSILEKIEPIIARLISSVRLQAVAQFDAMLAEDIRKATNMKPSNLIDGVDMTDQAISIDTGINIVLHILEARREALKN